MTAIRAARPGDGARLRALAAAAFHDDEVAIAHELIDAALASDRDDRDYWLLVADAVASAPGGLGGYVCYGPTPMTSGTYDLYWVASHPQARGQSVASDLVRAMEAELRARGATGIRVETESGAEYQAARDLYRHLGYPVAAQLADFYRPGADLVIYFKRLP